MKYLLYPHGGSCNHGCEAIVRSTSRIIGGNIVLYSSRINEDKKYQLESCVNLSNLTIEIKRSTIAYLKAYICFHLGVYKAFDLLSFSPLLKSVKKKDIALSIGGDNYCYGVPQFIYLINEELRKHNIRTVLWGCSIEPSAIDENMLIDLKGYTKIIARESLTYNALIEKGLENVLLYPDPAFQLNRIDLPLPMGCVEGNMVGINLSPMIMANESIEGVTLANYIALIDFIISKTSMQVFLIPHVVWENNDDRKPLNILFDKFKNTNRIILLEDHNAEELKGFIARCRFMVAARTHASIAAYSQKVPTLVVGYSIKAKGIAKDIFGTHESYVISVNDLRKEDDLTQAFRYIMNHEEEIRTQYDLMMDNYCAKAFEAGDEVRKIVNYD